MVWVPSTLQYLASESASRENEAVARHHRTFHSITILCGEKSLSRIRWVKIFTPEGSARFRRRGACRLLPSYRSTAVWSTEDSLSPSDCIIWKLLRQLGQPRITCRRNLFSRPHTITSRGRDVHRHFISWADRTGLISVWERGYDCNGNLT